MADNKLTTNTNSFVISGNLVRDSELVTVGNGFTILNFSVANNYIQKSGEVYEQKVNYFDCKLLGKRAEKLVNILKKGTSVICRGEVRQERWQTQDGKTASRVTFQCEDIEVTRWPQNQDDVHGPNAVYHGNGKVSTQQTPQGNFPEDIPYPQGDDSHIPF